MIKPRQLHCKGHTIKHGFFFACSHPTSGSFIRPHKANRGKSLMTALQDRYGKVEDESGGIHEEEMYVVGSNQKITVVEVVGAKLINKLQRYILVLLLFFL